jgi:16S rRNA (guanine527-N7)-methyltransferase
VSNLISRNDEPRIVTRHVLESLEPVSWIAKDQIDEWLDFGSGAGFPAVPMAIAGVGKRWTLVESRRPKTLFLRKLLDTIEINAEIEVRHARLESLVGELPRVGGFTSRATERLGPTLALAASFVQPGGRAYLWKGSSWRVELESDRRWELDWSLEEHSPLSLSQGVVVKFARR